MDRQRVTRVRKKTGDGNYTTPIPIGAKAENITLANGTVLQDAVDELQHGKAGHEVLTYAQWNALSDNEKNNGTVYFVTDKDINQNNQAVLVTFNNNESGLTATNVQTAIEEVNNKVAPMIVDNLESINPNAVLSANQGRVLKDQIDVLEEEITTNENNITALQDKTDDIIVMRSIRRTIPAGTNHINGSAVIDPGYTFVGWAFCASQGWVGPIYPATNNQNTVFYTTPTRTVDGDFDAFYILRK